MVWFINVSMVKVLMLLEASIYRFKPHCFTASFYGDSFLFQSVQLPSLDTTSVYLRFQTSSSDGLMLLALGDKGYLSVEVKNAQIVVSKHKFFLITQRRMTNYTVMQLLMSSSRMIL